MMMVMFIPGGQFCAHHSQSGVRATIVVGNPTHTASDAYRGIDYTNWVRALSSRGSNHITRRFAWHLVIV